MALVITYIKTFSFLLNSLVKINSKLNSKQRVDYFTVYSVTWPLNGCEAEGDLVLIQTTVFAVQIKLFLG